MVKVNRNCYQHHGAQVKLLLKLGDEDVGADQLVLVRLLYLPNDVD